MEVAIQICSVESFSKKFCKAHKKTHALVYLFNRGTHYYYYYDDDDDDDDDDADDDDDFYSVKEIGFSKP